MAASRESHVIEVFTGLADRLVDDFDVVELTTRLTEDCAKLLDVAAVGLLLADAVGELHLLAATSAEARKLEAFQLQRDEGPCLDCYHSGEPVSVTDLRIGPDRWPRFAVAAEQQGFRSVHAIPMRLRRSRLGALGLFGTAPGQLHGADQQLAQGLAHVASMAILQNNRNRTPDREALAPALQAAVASRAVVELAKGMLTELHGIGMEESFVRLRRYAADHHEALTEVARQVVERTISADQLLVG